MDLAFRTPYTVFEDQEMTNSKKKIVIPLAHIFVWLVFLSLPAIFNPRRHGVGIFSFINDLMEPPRWTNGLFLVILFYFNYCIAIPMLFFRRRYLLLSLSVVVSFILFFILNYSMMPPEIKNDTSGSFNALGNSFNLFMLLIIYCSSFALNLYEKWQNTKEQMLNTEILFLKAQINPHFLFNTLNSIYSLALTKSDDAPDAIIKLSAMMRYSVTDSKQNFVLLSKEVDYITNYIELQKLRLTNKVKISFDVEGQAIGKQVAPFLFIPFVENALKHGVNAEEDSDIRIKIDIHSTHMYLHVTNNKVFMRKDIAKGVGLGIKTTRKRLRSLYPGRHVLDVADTEKEFSVSLKIEF